MKNPEIGWKNSIFSKLIFMLLLIIVPLYFGGISIYAWGMQSVKEEITHSMVYQVEFYLDILEREIRRIRTLQYEFMGDSDLNKLATVYEAMDSIEKTDTIKSLQQKLYTLESSSDYISRASVYIPLMDRTIYVNNISDIMDITYKIPEEPLHQFSTQIISFDDSLLLMSIDVTRGIPGKNPLFIVAIELSRNKLSNDLLQMNDYEGSSVILLDSNFKYSISKDFNNDLLNDLQRSIEGKSVKNKSNAATLYLKNKPFLAIYSTSEYLDVILCKCVPEDIKNITVPRLIVQPLIENSFEHGLKNKVNNGLLTIKFEHDCEKVCIYVEDNGPGMDYNEIERLNMLLHNTDDDAESTAIINIHRRIQLMYGSESGLKFSIGQLGGLKTQIIICYKKDK